MNKVLINTYNEDIDKNAYLNWRLNYHDPLQNMIVMADGYITSIKVNVEACLKNPYEKQADILIFPMLFSLNHGIELYLKATCWALNILLGYKGSYKENHDIRNIWYTVKNKNKELRFDITRPEDTFNDMANRIEPYLDELASYLKTDILNDYFNNIDFSRYPMNNRKEYHFFANQFDNVTVDLEVLLSFAESINHDLKCLSTYYYSLVLESWQEQADL